jgi:hypothetical protein
MSEAVRALFEKIGWFPAGEENLERNEAQLNKLTLKELERAGRLSRRWIKEGNKWIQLLKRNTVPCESFRDENPRRLRFAMPRGVSGN